MIEDLSERIKHVSLKLEKVKSIPGADVFANNQESVKYATNDDIISLQASLQTLRSHVLQFSKIHDESFSKITRGDTRAE